MKNGPERNGTSAIMVVQNDLLLQVDDKGDSSLSYAPSKERRLFNPKRRLEETNGTIHADVFTSKELKDDLSSLPLRGDNDRD